MLMVILLHLLKLNILILKTNERRSYLVWALFYVLVKVFYGLIMFYVSIATENYYQNDIMKP